MSIFNDNSPDSEFYEPDVQDFVSSQDCPKCGSAAYSDPYECETCEREWDRASKACANYYKKIEEEKTEKNNDG